MIKIRTHLTILGFCLLCNAYSGCSLISILTPTYVSDQGAKMRIPGSWQWTLPKKDDNYLSVSNYSGSAAISIMKNPANKEVMLAEDAKLYSAWPSQKISTFGHFEGEGVTYSRLNQFEDVGGERSENTTFFTKGSSAGWYISTHFAGGVEDRKEFDTVIESLTFDPIK